MGNEIDLSKIKIKETAKQTIEANFDGTVKTYTIRALSDAEKVNFYSLLGSTKEVFRTRNMYVCLLSCGLNIEENVAARVFEGANEEAIRVGDAIFKLSAMMEEAKIEEAEAASKNSGKGAK